MPVQDGRKRKGDSDVEEGDRRKPEKRPKVGTSCKPDKAGDLLRRWYATVLEAPSDVRSSTLWTPSDLTGASADPSAGGLVGERVLVHGLVANPESNNRTGTATGWDSERKRYIVQLHRVDGSMVSLKMKPANLRKL